MKVEAGAPRIQLFVCTHARPASDPLGAGCGARGQAVHDALVAEVGRRGAWRRTWLARTSCLGMCPALGCSVAVSPTGARLDEVTVEDVGPLLDAVLASK